MHLVFGDGKVGIIIAGTKDNGVMDVLILDPDHGLGKLGQRANPKDLEERPFNLNSAVLQFKNSISVDLLIGELQRMKKNMKDAEALGWQGTDPWHVQLYLEPEA